MWWYTEQSCDMQHRSCDTSANEPSGGKTDFPIWYTDNKV